MERTRVISEGALTILLNRGDNSTFQNGFRTVSNTSYMSDDSLDSQRTVEIPEYLQSVESIHFLEFNEATSHKIYEDFTRAAMQDPDRAHILISAREHVRSISGNADERHGSGVWVGVLQAIGMTSNFQNRIMDPEFEDMRKMGTAKGWVLEAIETRYVFLQQLDNIIETPALGVARKTSYLDLQGNFQPGRPPIPERQSSKKLPAMGIFKYPTKVSSSTTVDQPKVSLEDHKILYKGGALCRLQKIQMENGQLNFAKILSPSPGDFDGFVGGLYFNKQSQVAHRYAKWAEKVVDGKVVPVGIMRVAVPNDLLTSIAEIYGTDWQEFVYANRTAQVPFDHNHHLHYLDGFSWLVGPICSQSNEVVQELASQGDIKAMKLERGEMASQIWTGKKSMCLLLDQRCQGKVKIEGLGIGRTDK